MPTAAPPLPSNFGGPTQTWDPDALAGATRSPRIPTLDEVTQWFQEGMLAEAGIDAPAPAAPAQQPAVAAPVVPAAAGPARAPAPPQPGMIGRPFNPQTGEPTPAAAPAPAPPVIPDSGRVWVDTSRGEAGRDWLASHPERQRAPAITNSPELYGPGGGNLTQADFEGRANARRMIEAAYPDAEPFDPVKAQIEDLSARGDLALAQLRAEDPVRFAEMQAGLPERAKMAARLQAAGVPQGETMYTFLGKIEDQIAALETELARRQAEAKAKGLPQEAIDAASSKPLAEIQRLKGHQLLMQQTMGFATGQTPSALYAQGRY